MKSHVVVDLELAREFLNGTSSSKSSESASSEAKKKAAAERKELKALKEEATVRISIAFKEPWWAFGEGDR